jgi:3-hydroxyisobutyrate dehydrogenase-like beta-hydroxyacid dehydrogenase
VATVGGTAEAFALAEPALKAFAAPLLHMGPLGSGMQTKLMLNMLQYGLAVLGFETGSLLRAAGIDNNAFVEAFRARDLMGPNLIDYLSVAGSSFEASGMTLDAIGRYGVKDLPAALALGTELNVALPTAEHNLKTLMAMTQNPAD